MPVGAGAWREEHVRDSDVLFGERSVAVDDTMKVPDRSAASEPTPRLMKYIDGPPVSAIVTTQSYD